MNSRTKTLQATLPALLVALMLAACGDKPEALLLSAKDYLAKNDKKAAVIQIKNALQANPDLPEARYLLGTTLLDSGDPVGAETELRKALDLKHSRDVVIPQLAKALLAQGQAKKLTDELSKTELGQPHATASFQMALTSAYAMQGKNELSQAALNAALQAEPGNAAALIEQARQKASSGDLDGALALLQDVIAKAPSNHEAWKLKGDIYLRAKNQPVDALAAYRKAVDLSPEYLAGHAALLTMLLAQGQFPEAGKQLEQLKKSAPNHPQTRYFEAQLAYQKKDYVLARDLLQKVLSVAPNDVLAQQLAGIVALQLNAWGPAQTHLSRVLQSAPQLALARRGLIMAYLRSGQPAKALEALLPGLERPVIDPELLTLAGQVYLQNGDVKKAEDYFLQATRHSPQDPAKRTTLALTRLMNGTTDGVFEELNDIAGSDAGTMADMALISAHARRNEFDKALKAVDGLEKKQPGKPLAAQLRAQIQLGKRDVVGGRKSFEQVLEIDPNYFAAVAGLAALDLADKQPERAKKRVEAVLARDPKNTQALLALAEIAASSGAEKTEVAKHLTAAIAASPTDAVPRFLLIDFHLRNQDLKEAMSVAQNAVAALPDNAKLLEALGVVQQASGELNQATTTFNKLVALQPQSPLPHLRLAEVHRIAKNKDAAVQSLQKALEIRPDLLEAQRGLILFNIDARKYQEALVIARRVQKQRPSDGEGLALEGDILVVQKNWMGATTAYREALKQMKSTELAIKLHSVFQVAGKEGEADKLSVSWKSEHPKDARFLFYLADQALKRGDYDTAERSYTAVIQLQANNAIAYNNLAWVTAKLNKEGAMAFAEKANTLAPNQPAFMDTLAMLLSAKGDYAKALAVQTKALALQPKNPTLKLNLVKIYIQSDQKELARKGLDELAKLGSEFSGQAEVAQLLKVL